MGDDDLKIPSGRNVPGGIPTDAAVLLAKQAAARESRIAADLRHKAAGSPKGDEVSAHEAEQRRKERTEEARERAAAAKESAEPGKKKQDHQESSSDTGRVDIDA